jgi:hypothetical protein
MTQTPMSHPQAFPVQWVFNRATLSAAFICLLFLVFACVCGVFLWSVAAGFFVSSSSSLSDLVALLFLIAIQILFLAPTVLFLREIVISYWLAKFGIAVHATVIWSLKIKGGSHIQVQFPWNGVTQSLWLSNGFYSPVKPCGQHDQLEIYLLTSPRNASRIRWAMGVQGIPFKRK